MAKINPHENPHEIKPEPKLKRKRVRLDDRTVLLVPAHLTDEEIEEHLEKYRNRQRSCCRVELTWRR